MIIIICSFTAPAALAAGAFLKLQKLGDCLFSEISVNCLDSGWLEDLIGFPKGANDALRDDGNEKLYFSKADFL